MPRLLIIQTGFLGDAVLASGMLRLISSVSPATEVGVAVRPEFCELFENHPVATYVHPVAKRERGGVQKFIEELRAVGYSNSVIPHRSFRSVYAAWRAGIRQRVGFIQSDAPWLLTDRVEYRIAEHETARNARLLERLGIFGSRVEDRFPQLFPDHDLLARMRSRFDDGRRVILLAPGSVWPTKRWIPKGYAEVAAHAVRDGARALLIGNGGERDLALHIARTGGIPESDVLCGELSLRQLLALIAIAGRVIANDSAPLHLAESVGTPVTAIFGPTVPGFGFAPQLSQSSIVEIAGLPCRPCRIHGGDRCPIGTHECMTAITSERVMEGARERG